MSMASTFSGLIENSFKPIIMKKRQCTAKNLNN